MGEWVFVHSLNYMSVASLPIATYIFVLVSYLGLIIKYVTFHNLQFSVTQIRSLRSIFGIRKLMSCLSTVVFIISSTSIIKINTLASPLGISALNHLSPPTIQGNKYHSPLTPRL